MNGVRERSDLRLELCGLPGATLRLRRPEDLSASLKATSAPADGRGMPNAKGTVMVGLVKSLRRNKERARELLAPPLAHYLEDRINLGSWYPLEDFLTLLRLSGKFAPASPPRFRAVSTTAICRP